MSPKIGSKHLGDRSVMHVTLTHSLYQVGAIPSMAIRLFQEKPQVETSVTWPLRSSSVVLKGRCRMA